MNRSPTYRSRRLALRSVCALQNMHFKMVAGSSVVRAFAHGAMGRRIDPSWAGPIELFLVPASTPRLVSQRPWYYSANRKE